MGDGVGGEGGNDGFAGADITLEEAIHGQVAAEILEDFPRGATLGVGQSERQARDEGFGRLLVEGDGEGFEFRGLFAVQVGGKDKLEKFFVGEVMATSLDVVGVFGEMDAIERVATDAWLYKVRSIFCNWQ